MDIDTFIAIIIRFNDERANCLYWAQNYDQCPQGVQANMLARIEEIEKQINDLVLKRAELIKENVQGDCILDNTNES